MKTINIEEEIVRQDIERENIEEQIKKLRGGVGLEALQVELFKKHIIINYIGRFLREENI